ncbi:helicase associated domain-containing protein [Kitasatospora sp. NPDC001540]|uniref:helicase associated domain-containing protein n=1 Tax=Kitasatospora sp. NPDC001540 TaxID=3364014 RepID=UPI003698CE35
MDQLESLGMIWAVSAARFEMGLSWARTWAREHYGSLAVPARALIGNDFALGQWLARLRTAAEVPEGEPGALDPAWRQALEEIDPHWAPRWPITWQRAYVAARTWWQEADGRVDWPALPAETVFEGEQLGHWVAAQRGAFADLEHEQQDLLLAIGIEEDPALAQAAAVEKARKAAAAGRPKKPAVSRADRFALGLAALAQFVAREGRDKPVPRSHIEVLERVVVGPDAVESTGATPVKLGSWVGNQRTRRASLSEEQIAALAEHGLVLG